MHTHTNQQKTVHNFRVFAVLLNLWVIVPFLKPWKAFSLHLGKYSHGFLIYRIQMITLACSSSLLSDCREVCNHSFFSPLNKSALPWVPQLQMSQWLNGSSGAQQGPGHALSWSAFLCPTLATQRSFPATLPVWEMHSPSGSWEQKFLHHFGGVGAGPPTMLVLGLWRVWSVAVE